MSHSNSHLVAPPAAAFAYSRFSNAEQGSGDSVRRQTEYRDNFLTRRPHLTLDTKLVFHDKGKSGFSRDGIKDYAIGRFIELVKNGTILPGSYLIIENLDRLSREAPFVAMGLLTDLVRAGITVAVLTPVELILDKSTDAGPAIMSLMELIRGNGESSRKSSLMGPIWKHKRETAATAIVTASHPSWLKIVGRERKGKHVVGGKFVIDEPKANIVRRIFDMCLAGKGTASIARTFNEEGVPVIGRVTYMGKPVVWSKTVVYQLLQSRAVIGEFQQHIGHGKTKKPAGDPVPAYFPRIITDDVWHAARASIATRVTVDGRGKGGGQKGKTVNILAGLLSTADGRSLGRKTMPGKPSVFVANDTQHGSGRSWISFPAIPLEAAILSQLKEVTAADITPATSENSPANRVLVLQGELSESVKQIAHWEARLDDLTIADTAARKQADWIAKRKQLTADLATAEAEAASPVSTAWTEARSLMQLLAEDNTDATRQLVKASLRRSIKSIKCEFLPIDDGIRTARIGVVFATGIKRRYKILVRSPKANRHRRIPGQWWALSHLYEPLDYPPLNPNDPPETTEPPAKSSMVFNMVPIDKQLAKIPKLTPETIVGYAGCTTGVIE